MEEKEMLENVEHCIKNFNGKRVDCIAVGNIYKKYVEQKSELEKYKNIAEKLAEVVDLGMMDFNCGMCVHDNCIKECALEWARKEVESNV